MNDNTLSTGGRAFHKFISCLTDEKSLAGSGWSNFYQNKRNILTCQCNKTHQNDTSDSKAVAYHQSTAKNGPSQVQ